MIIETQVHARAGLVGNPSDMYGGKVLSFIIKDFSTRVRLWESPRLTFRLHPQHDRTEFDDLQDLVHSVNRHGYYGMQRLLLATCRRFAEYCEQRGIALRRASFTLEYETDIPRQSGLGGSSAIIIAALKALLRFYRVPHGAVPERELADLALSVETKELRIAAGPQDRVVQAYGGLTYMDFSKRHPHYERMDSRLLPRFAIAHLSEEQMGRRESGEVHSQVRYRWERGDPEVRRIMRALARCAQVGRDALLKRDLRRLGQVMNRNFDLRRSLFGDAALGEHNIVLVQIARNLGFPAKMTGSGGTALILLDRPEREEALARAYAEAGYQYMRVHAA